MGKSIDDIDKKRGRGRPVTDATPVLTRLWPDLLGKLDAWRGSQPDVPGRPEAIRRLIESGLKSAARKPRHPVSQMTLKAAKSFAEPNPVLAAMDSKTRKGDKKVTPEK